MSLDACADLVRRGDPDRFLAAMAAPPAARARLFPLYAFNLEVARAPWVTAEPLIAQMRLQWWRDALDEIAAGAPPRAHEVVAPLADVVAQVRLPQAPFAALIDARDWDIGRDPFPDPAARNAYVAASGGGLMWLSALALGADAGLEQAARDVGFAAGMAQFLLAVPALRAAGRQPLSEADEVVAAAKAGLAALARARGTRFGPATPALRAGWRAGALLRGAQDDPRAVLDGRLVQSEFRRRGGLLLRAALGRW
ncbi:MAG: phytoene synthase [Limimaricola sp.]|uniref:squalene/phytoene synthase family protein n=1 Tax=Limimaricola sp. TaxID=2211665 RepID=UPI001D43298E|nr:squalene/phytoene synthase family protein [Limimaricola sp.]MBI1418238.1 phytoene synthase [Limimaricola sp.]